MSGISVADMTTELQSYGISAGSVRTFVGAATPDLIDYLDLMKARVTRAGDPLPDGVAENQGRPLLYFINESRLAQSADEQGRQLTDLRHKLACRGHRAYLARVKPGQLLVEPISFEDREPEWKLYEKGSGQALTFFSRLALGHYDGKGEPAGAHYVFKEMFTLLEHAANGLARRVDKGAVLSLVGRALFFRFLRDRQVVTEENTKAIAPKATDLCACFDTVENAAATSQWLDHTFNGDFMPLPKKGDRTFFDDIAQKTNGAVFKHLSAIVRGALPAGPDHYQLTLNLHWGDFDFAHIPVGLLSQVYERFCWEWEKQDAMDTSVHYTPRNIAATLVDEAFDRLPEAHQCCVLDPACGAGVFLVLAFRRLYRERWEATREQPNTKAIRAILENQLKGFDINDSALKLSALSLYLTAIELDPKPVPPNKLRFRPLLDRVLFNHRRRDEDQREGPVIGSLNPAIGNRFDGKFDLVLSNPPWTNLSSKKHATLVTALSRVSIDIIKRRGDDALANEYHNPDNSPDLPFLWKSTEWCKPDGRIAMALPARILLKQEDVPCRAREAMFRLLEVTGIINCSNLSDTNVWPDMSEPFMLLFARNRKSKAGHAFHVITPQIDTVLNHAGEVRIDSKSAQLVEVEATFDEPWLWKALAVGTTLDVDVIRRIRGVRGRGLLSYWRTDLGLTSCTGYMIKAKQAQLDANHLWGLPNLTTAYDGRFAVDTTRLEPFHRATACRPRKREVYRAPLVLVKQSPGFRREDCWAFLSLSDIAFSQDYYGYSSADHPEGSLLARYLFLFCHSLIWIHHALMTDPVFGAERRVIYKTAMDTCPLASLDQLNGTQRRFVMDVSARLLCGKTNVLPEIDAFFASLYGLDKFDLEVIRDTLAVCLPYGESRERACSQPNPTEREIFRRRMESMLRPFFKVLGKAPRVVAWISDGSFVSNSVPLGVLLIQQKGTVTAAPDEVVWKELLSLANETGTTRIIKRVEGGLLVGILNQYRYWTPSRARLLCAEIVRQHMSVFED